MHVHAEEAFNQVDLHWNGKKHELSESGKNKLLEQALKLVETSNFHSGVGDKNAIYTLHGVQSDYRATVAGRFLVCRFQTSKQVATKGGDVAIFEIVIGMNHDDAAYKLFTVDENGSIVQHGKYSGQLCIEILQAVKIIRSKKPNKAEMATPRKPSD